MSKFEDLQILDFDHIEFAVSDLDQSAKLYAQLGFERVATREILQRHLRSYLMAQGNTFVVLSHSSDSKDPVNRYVAAHGDGVMSVAFKCEDAVSALEIAHQRGATIVQSPRAYKKDFGQVEEAAIGAFGDVRHTFVSRKGNLFLEGFDHPVKPLNRGYGVERIDHITVNVEKGKLDEWSSFYERIFGLQNVRFFDIHTQRTGLYSKVMQSPNGVIKMPINEPTESTSQIQEFIDVHHGPGVQHLALHTQEIGNSLRQIRKQGIQFLEVPHTYYEAVPKRVPGVTENLSEMEELGILIDGDEKGYLLQIFSHNVVGPFFYEFIQRKGNDGFGEGNFGALFEAIERDQIRRGVLKE